jgi:phospholipase C
MVIVEENKRYDQVIGSDSAPYLNQLADEFGLATAMHAGYPAHCPSLAAYIILTSGDANGICDDRNPSEHPLSGESIFSQVVASGRAWRSYAEAMPENCMLTNSSDGRYLVRHVPATYYLGERTRCERWTVPLGTPEDGAFQHDVATGALPAYSMVTPDACDDMHGSFDCEQGQVAQGDSWLAQWVPKILSGPDYQTRRLVIFIVWDEGTRSDNHVPAIVVSPATQRIVSTMSWTHCAVLRTTEEILGLPLLGCAAESSSMREAFKL